MNLPLFILIFRQYSCIRNINISQVMTRKGTQYNKSKLIMHHFIKPLSQHSHLPSLGEHSFSLDINALDKHIISLSKPTCATHWWSPLSSTSWIAVVHPKIHLVEIRFIWHRLWELNHEIWCLPHIEKGLSYT